MPPNKPVRKLEPKLIPQDVEDRARDEINLDASDVDYSALYPDGFDDDLKKK